MGLGRGGVDQRGVNVGGFGHGGVSIVSHGLQPLWVLRRTDAALRKAEIADFLVQHERTLCAVPFSLCEKEVLI
ncbi:hypothetical protein Cst04h_27670 [Corynebacterium striatum]|uniref:Uncharacterized protein n=1 Tax=Corynebacterium striatum TaxID=43770 RepID=A0ABC9ZIM1_CORST|nr:hypothetical protein Cst04h_01820 [Corynebacterium striatum]GEA44597.1 hypothetical protein Cst04h_27670 [Corynebacterium striatum]